jgi:hypothetical protein
VIGDLVATLDQPLARDDLVHQAVFERLLGIDRLCGQRRVARALRPQEFLEGVAAGIDPMT